jgi:hypothetical protein
MNSWIDLHALWEIVVIGLLAGAGLPALFALGLRALGLREQPATATEPDHLVGGRPLGIAAGSVCFAVVLGCIGWGIYLIVEAT